METLNVTATRDQEQFYRIINNLISTNKEFQIMITVPSGEKNRWQQVPPRRQRQNLWCGIWKRT